MADQINDVVQVQITAATQTPSQPGFSSTLVIGYHTKYSDLVRPYNQASDMIADGFTVNDALYRAVASAFAQNPSPSVVKVGRGQHAVAWVGKVTITDALAGDLIKLSIFDELGNETDISYTILASATTSTVATAVQALMTSITGLTSSVTGNVITLTGASAGKLFFVQGQLGCEFYDATPSMSYDADLTACLAFDSDFFGVALSNNSSLNVAPAAAWALTNKRLLAVASSDDRESQTGNGVIFPALKTAANPFVYPMFSKNPLAYPAMAMLGKQLPKQPGSSNWAFKQLAGVSADALSAAQITALNASNVNYYLTIRNINVTQYGHVSDGEWVDNIVGTQWLITRIQTRCFTQEVQQEKIDYDDAGIAILQAEVKGALQEAVDSKLLTAGTIYVNVGLASSATPTDRGLRQLTTLTFGGQYRGAINKSAFKGTLTI